MDNPAFADSQKDEKHCNLEPKTTGPEDDMVATQDTDVIGEIPKTPEASQDLVHLKRELNLWNGVGIIVGTIIGSGIFVSPGNILMYTGSIGLSLIIWVTSGVRGIIGGLCFAELGTMIPKSGAAYSYILEAFGPIPAFLILWTQVMIEKPSSRTIIALTFASYLLQPNFPSCMAPPYNAVRLVAAAMLFLLAYINCAGVKLGTRVQDSFSLVKVISLIFIIAAGFYHLGKGNVENLLHPMEGTVTNPTMIATSFYSANFAYAGWDALNLVTEELKDPYRNLPRAIAISIITVIIIYTLANIAYFVVLTPGEILSSSAVAVTFSNRMFGSEVAWIISIFVACSTFGCNNGGYITESRLQYAGARDGHLPRFLSLIHVKTHTPVTSVMSLTIIPIFLLFIPDLGSLFAYTSFTRNLSDLICVLALLWLRYKEPDRHRPIKVWLGFPILFLVLSLFVAIFPVVQRPIEIAVAAGIIICGLIVYYFTIYLEIKFLRDMMAKITCFCQVLLLCVQEEKAD